MPPMPVEVAPVTVQKVEDKFEAVGTIEAVDAITVVSEIDGAVISLPFREGEAIERGGLIAKLDDSQLAAELSRNRCRHQRRPQPSADRLCRESPHSRRQQ